MTTQNEVLLSKGRLGIHCRINSTIERFGEFKNVSYVLYCNSKVIIGKKITNPKGNEADDISKYDMLFSHEDFLEARAVTEDEVMVLSMTIPGWDDLDTKMVYIASGLSILFHNNASEEYIASWAEAQF